MTGDIAVLGSNTDQRIALIALAYSGVSGVTGVLGESEGSTNTPAITITSPSGDTAVMFGTTVELGANARITASPETERADTDTAFSSSAYFAIDTPGAGSTTLDATSVAARTWFTYGLSLTGAGGGGETLMGAQCL
jgi:hypothetical protein